MSLIALIVFLVASALVVASADPVQESRKRKAARREKQEREKAEERDRAAEAQKKEAEERVRQARRKRERLALPEGFRARRETLRTTALVSLAPLEDAHRSAVERGERLGQTSQSVMAVLPGSSSVWKVVTALLVGGIWVVAGVAEVTLDQHSFAGLRYPQLTSLLLAAVTALAFSLLGLILSDLVGLTRLLPLPREMRPLVRGAAIADVLAVLIFGLTLLTPILEYRSAPTAAQVATLEQNQRVLERTPGLDPQLKVNTAQRLAAAKEKRDTARQTDQRLGVAAALVEVATSWGAVWLGLMLANGALTTLAGREKRRAQRIKVQMDQQDRRFQADLAALAEEVGISPEQLREILKDPPAPAPEPEEKQEREPPRQEREEPPAQEPPRRQEPPAQQPPPPDQQRNEPPPGDWWAF
jgi:hypothetical protein